MKTPREILLNSHKEAQPRLDGLRQKFLRDLASPLQFPQQQPGVVVSSVPGWREILVFVRWHLAGLAAIWLIVAVLKVSDTQVDDSPPAQAKAAPPRTFVLTLIENRRQILEFSGDTVIVPPLFLQGQPQRRSLLQTSWAWA
jgi:hypothetical protein